MENNNIINIKTDNSWAYIELDENNTISDFNKKAIEYYPDISINKHITDILPWFNIEWRNDAVKKRLIKTSLEDRALLEFVQKDKNCTKILINDIFEFKDVMQAWCEIGHSLIKLQPLIDSYDDAIMITNGEGIIRAFNSEFIKISGLDNVKLINKSIYQLEKEGVFPHCAVMDVISTGKAHHSLVKFSNGNETIMSANPLYKDGRIIRITTNIRNVNELNKLYGELSEDRYVNKKQYINKMKVYKALESLNIQFPVSPKMEEVFRTIENVVDYDLPLLITGETGTGKTTIAKCIYLSKSKVKGNFVHINCSAIPETLIESELFGYEKGSFTGAEKTKIGLFEEADGGVILLDEIGDMPLQLQAKLLNVIQEKKFYRVGGVKPIETNTQVIAATHQDLSKLVAKGLFREDLFFRLNVIPINIPPLRERKEDMYMLIAQTIREFNLKYGLNKTCSNEVMDALLQYDWPGNVRELKNVVERLMFLSKKDIIQKKDLPKEVMSTGYKANFKKNTLHEYNESLNKNLEEPQQSLKSMISEIESIIIEEAIEKYGSIRKAAEKLGVNQSTITRKRKKK